MGFLFFMGALTCGLAYIIEKKDGMLNRTLVAGVTTMEIVMGHLLTQFAVVIVQAIIAFVIMFVVFDIPKIGSPVLAFAITILNSIAGMSVGKLKFQIPLQLLWLCGFHSDFQIRRRLAPSVLTSCF
jgi:ABC-type multidrug transport system permease subunit